jgi:DNA replication initiation complex subunit (GINS family)
MRVCQRRRIASQQEVHELVQEGNELISIVTAIVTNKRKSVAARRAAEKEAKAAAKQTRNLGRRAQAAKPQARGHEFKIPNS